MDLMDITNAVLLVISLGLIILITVGLIRLKDLPEDIRVEVMGIGRMKFKPLILGNCILLTVLMILVYKYTELFTWISTGLLFATVAYFGLAIYKKKNS